MMLSHTKKIVIMVMLFSCFHVYPSWSQEKVDIAVLIPQGWILEGDDPANDIPPGAKDFTFEGIELIHSFSFFRFISHLEDTGFNVKLYGSDTDDPVEVQSNSDVIYIPEAIGSASVLADYRNSPTPVIVAETFLLDDMGFVSITDGLSNDLNANMLKVVNPNHPITQGLPEVFPIGIPDPAANEPSFVVLNSFKTPALLADLANANVGEVVVTASGFDVRDPMGPLEDNPAVIAVETGTGLVGGGSTQARWVYLPFSDKAVVESPINAASDGRTYELLSDFGFQIIVQAVEWALEQSANISGWEVFE